MFIRNYFKSLFTYSILSILITLIAIKCVLGADTTRYGAVVVCSQDQSSDPKLVQPKLVFPDKNNNDWKVVTDEAYTGFDSHRFYFTIECPRKNAESPVVEVQWDKINIDRVINSQELFEKTSTGVRFIPGLTYAPTGVFTEITFGSIHLGIFHNWDVRRCGPYRDSNYPYIQIKAQLNYMLALLEVCRAYGWTQSGTPDYVDHINIYGFETHFPNGHRDYPAHFHIMLGWDGWNNANVGHYLLDKQGNLHKNTFWVLHEDIECFHLPGDISCYKDGAGREIISTNILSDGSGLIFSKVGAKQEYLLRAGSKGSAESVEVCIRGQEASQEWKVICEVIASDDSTKGFFSSEAKYLDGTVQLVEFKYDPDTGTKLSY